MGLSADWFGDRAVLVHLGDDGSRTDVVTALAGALPDLTVRAGIDTVLVESPEPDPALLPRVRAALTTSTSVRAGADRRHEVVVDVAYDGPDLVETAALLGCATERLVGAHVAQTWRVALLGFAPGFAYLEVVGEPVLDWQAVARHDSPRARVPVGSVALAAGYSAVYPQEMPGGWRLVGRAQVRLFDTTDTTDPALLHPGDIVRFRAV